MEMYKGKSQYGLYQNHKDLSHGKEEMGSFIQSIYFIYTESSSSEPNI